MACARHYRSAIGACRHNQWQQITTMVHLFRCRWQSGGPVPVLGQRYGCDQRLFLDSRQCPLGGQHDIDVRRPICPTCGCAPDRPAGSETMWVRAFDGTDWGDWEKFTFTTIPNTPPVATISDQSLHVNQWAQVSDLAELLRRQRRCRHQIPVLGQRHGGDQRLFLDADQLALGRQHNDRGFGRRSCQRLGAGRHRRPAPKRCGYARSTATTGALGTPSRVTIDERNARRHRQRSFAARQSMGAGRQLDQRSPTRTTTRSRSTSSGTAARPQTAPISGRRPTRIGLPTPRSRSLPPISPMSGSRAARRPAPRRCGSAPSTATNGATGILSR